jgi:hypothetical protein
MFKYLLLDHAVRADCLRWRLAILPFAYGYISKSAARRFELAIVAVPVAAVYPGSNNFYCKRT